MSEDDVLVGLRFEVSGGLGRMSGEVIGKAGQLYLVQKQGAEHLELLAIDDLRSAKFYRRPEPVAAMPPEPATGGAPESAGPPRRRLSDQIRKKLSGS